MRVRRQFGALKYQRFVALCGVLAWFPGLFVTVMYVLRVLPNVFDALRPKERWIRGQPAGFSTGETSRYICRGESGEWKPRSQVRIRRGQRHSYSLLAGLCLDRVIVERCSFDGFNSVMLLQRGANTLDYVDSC